ncbi:hypothetical protein L1987_39359 [Smallanthus sonchifolius]|uniref:Uncharacterized protein n=1 Tax=Smallanthus sonchifolius TaxID=185202 RepID=A0ACB9HLU0_9ASTR|nr:hypothetical protein L1987_39359 [Smallanthus sonchifolius]
MRFIGSVHCRRYNYSNRLCPFRIRESAPQDPIPKDPFEAAFEEIDDSPPDTPYTHEDTEAQTLATQATIKSQRYDVENNINPLNQTRPRVKLASTSAANKNKEDDDDEEEEENMDVELGKFPSTGDPYKMG